MGDNQLFRIFMKSASVFTLGLDISTFLQFRSSPLSINLLLSVIEALFPMFYADFQGLVTYFRMAFRFCYTLCIFGYEFICKFLPSVSHTQDRCSIPHPLLQSYTQNPGWELQIYIYAPSYFCKWDCCIRIRRMCFSTRHPFPLKHKTLCILSKDIQFQVAKQSLWPIYFPSPELSFHFDPIWMARRRHNDVLMSYVSFNRVYLLPTRLAWAMGQ